MRGMSGLLPGLKKGGSGGTKIGTATLFKQAVLFRRKLKSSPQDGFDDDAVAAAAELREAELEEKRHNVSLKASALGHFSVALYKANEVMEDAVQVEETHDSVFITVHDGHGGNQVAEFVKGSLIEKLKTEFSNDSVSEEALCRAFLAADREFADIVRDEFDESPHLATAGACSAVAFVSKGALWVANVGDCRAVLGQVSDPPVDGDGNGSGSGCTPLQLSVDHNLSCSEIRDEFVSSHADTPDAVTEKMGRFRVKGKLAVTRAFGNLYLKSREFNDTLFTRFRIPEPFHPPLITVEPHVAVHLLNPHDSFVIVASDGLFELLSNQEAVDIVASSPRKGIAEALIRVTLERAAKKHGLSYEELLQKDPGEGSEGRRGFHDDISVVVFFFDHNSARENGS